MWYRNSCSSGYALRFEGQSGSNLATYSFEPGVTTNHEGPGTASFNFLLPFTVGTMRITLLQYGQSIASRQASAHAPTVTVTTPNGGESLSGAATVAWTAADQDGDALS